MTPEAHLAEVLAAYDNSPNPRLAEITTLLIRHLHEFVVAAPGHRTVITHLFDAASDYLDSDAVFGVRDSLIVDMSGDRCRYDFVLEVSPAA